MVELGQAPVDQPQLALLVVDHDVVGLDVPVHDALRVAEVQGLQKFKHVVAYVVVLSMWGTVTLKSVLLTCSKIRLGVLLCGSLTTSSRVMMSRPPQRFCVFDLPLNFLFHRLEDLDDATLVPVRHVDAVEDLGVLSSPYLAYDLVAVLVPPGDLQALVVPVAAGRFAHTSAYVLARDIFRVGRAPAGRLARHCRRSVVRAEGRKKRAGVLYGSGRCRSLVYGARGGDACQPFPVPPASDKSTRQ